MNTLYLMGGTFKDYQKVFDDIKSEKQINSILFIDEANKIIAFLSGVVYSINGTAKQLNDNAFLFATKENFLDGSLNEFLKNFK